MPLRSVSTMKNSKGGAAKFPINEGYAWRAIEIRDNFESARASRIILIEVTSRANDKYDGSQIRSDNARAPLAIRILARRGDCTNAAPLAIPKSVAHVIAVPWRRMG